MVFIQTRFLTFGQKDAGEAIYTSGNMALNLISDAFNLRKILSLYKSKTLELELVKHRAVLANARGKQTFIASIPRYFMEIMLTSGLILIGFTAYLTNGATSVMSSIGIFAAAGFRLLPIINRIQGLSLSAVGYEPLAREAFFIGEPKVSNTVKNRPNSSNDIILELKNISFKYRNSTKRILDDLSFNFEKGKQYAIVGPSGSGKTTLVDVILGLLQPTEGTVTVHYDSKSNVFGYIPQETYVLTSGIDENVALEWNSQTIDKNRILYAINQAQIESIKSNEQESQSNSSQNGSNLSGGQKQRLGLARAFYRDFEILILDEATSSLDAKTENEVMQSIEKLRGSKTVIIIAHRLSTVKNADVIIYLKNGKILGAENFRNLQFQVPEFEKQVRLGNLEN